MMKLAALHQFQANLNVIGLNLNLPITVGSGACMMWQRRCKNLAQRMRMRMRAVCRILSDQLPAGTRLPQLPAGRVITYATKNRDTHDDFYNSFSVCS